jgi:hypothetical protein
MTDREQLADEWQIRSDVAHPARVYWRPDHDPGPNADRAWAFGGIAAS